MSRIQLKFGRTFRRQDIAVGVVGVLAVLATAWLFLYRNSEAPASLESDRSAVEGTRSPASPHGATAELALPVDVQVVKPRRRDVTYSISLPANVAPLYQTTLYAKVSGYLKWIGPDKGDSVKNGQVLAIIDAPEVEEQYHQAVADYKIKKITYERLANVWKETPDVIAKQDVDVAEAGFQAAKHVMEQRVAMLDYTKVRAPYAGIITARFADPGALIQVATASATGAIPLFTIMDLDTVRIYTNVPQEDASMVKPGITKTLITLKELPDRRFESAVTRTTGSLDPSTRTLLVEIDLPNREHVLQPGTFVEATLILRTSPNALAVPAGAIVTSGGTKAVYVADAGRARLVPIRTGITDGRWIEVIEGLLGSEDVVVVGRTKLTDGSPLQASPYNLPEGTPGAQKFERRTSGFTPSPETKTSTESAPGSSK